MRLLVMAWRNLWRYRRRTLVTVAAMTLALSIMVLYTSLVEGYLRDLERNIVDIELGDIQVFAPDYRDNPSIYNRIENPEPLLAELRDRGLGASARLIGGGLAAAGESSAGAMLKGIDLAQDATVSQISQHVDRGSWLHAADQNGVVVGSRLAHTLGVEPGDELVLLGQATDGSIANDLYTVRGVLRSISEDADRGGIFMTEDAFRFFFSMPQGAHQLMIRRPAERDLPIAVTEVREIAAGLDVQSWRDLVPILATALDSTRSLIVIVFLVIYVVVAILIINAMLMSVFERINEIGVLKALGVSPRQVLTLIFIEGGLQTAIAIGVALTLSVPGLAYLADHGIDLSGMGSMSFAGMAFDPVWRGVVTPWVIVGPVLTLVFIVSVSVLYPALKAARISPVEAMRYQ
jgi:ABC-type lipoprotein release transport system permease subunit